MNHQPKNPDDDDNDAVAPVLSSEPWIGTQQLRPPPGTGTSITAASGSSNSKNTEQGTDKTKETEESSMTSSTGSRTMEEEEKGGDVAVGDNTNTTSSSSHHHHHQDQEQEKRKSSRLRLATPNGEVASLRPSSSEPESDSTSSSSKSPPPPPPPNNSSWANNDLPTEKHSLLEMASPTGSVVNHNNAVVPVRYSTTTTTNPSLTAAAAAASSEKQQSVARLSLATSNGEVHSIRPPASLTESAVADSSSEKQQSVARLSLATPNGDVHSIRPPSSTSLRASASSSASSSEKQQSVARLSLATPNGEVHSIRPPSSTSLRASASSSEKQESARLSLATPNGEVHSIMPPSSTSLRASASSSTSENEKQRLRLATPNGEVHTLIPTTTSNARSPLRNSNNNNLRSSTATNASTATEESVTQTGAFRVSQGGYLEDGTGNSEELYSITQPPSSSPSPTTSQTRATVDHGLLAEAIPIEAELAPEPAQQQQQQVDVEAIVEERIRERDKDLVVAEVASTTRHEEGGSDETATTFTQQSKRKRNLKIAINASILLAIVVVVLAIAFATTSKERKNEGEEEEDVAVVESTPPPTTTMSFNPTLQEVKNRDYVRCGAYQFDTGFSFHNTGTSKDDGFLIDICRAIAKVVLGDPEKHEIVYVTAVNRFQHLWDDEIDVLTQRATITMERDIASATNLTDGTNLGVSFSVPFHYTGMAFAGEPNYVDCADDLDSFSGDCRSLKICVRMGTTQETILNEIFPAPQKVLSETFEDVVDDLENGRCNILVGDSVAIPESQLRALGYTGEYKLGTNLFSKEPLAIATRDGDTEWSNIVNMIIDVILTAEKMGITQTNAVAELGAGATTDINFIQDDDDFRSLFVDVISTIGNMGELYQRHLEKDFPRHGLNLLNTAAEAGNTTTGLIYSFPFGNFNTNGKITEGGVMESILTRQKLRCGVSKMDGLADFDDETWMWTGLNIEFCVAVSAAIFESSNARDQVEFVEIFDTEDRLHSLASGEIDILAGERVTLQSKWKDPSTDMGYSFSPPYFYDDETGDSFSLATIRNDDSTEFSDFVFWVVMSTFYAEEHDITQSSPGDMPVVSLFGESLKQMFLDTIFAVDNYGNIYNKTMESLYPRIPGRNMLNLDNTPQMLGHPPN